MYAKKKTSRNVDTKQITNCIFEYLYQTVICKVQVHLFPLFLILCVSIFFLKYLYLTLGNMFQREITVI